MGEIYAFEHIHCRVIKHISVNVHGIILAHQGIGFKFSHAYAQSLFGIMRCRELYYALCKYMNFPWPGLAFAGSL